MRRNGARAELTAEEIRKILVVQIAPIGDTILATPALRALRGGYPRAEITVLASPRSVDVLRGAPHLDLLRTYRSGLDLWRTVTDLRHGGFDLAVGLSNAGSWIGSFCGARYQAGFPTPLLHRACPGGADLRPLAHVVEKCLAVALIAGGAAQDLWPPEIWIDPEERERADSFLSSRDLAGPLIAIHPGGHYFPFKRWPVERYAQLVKKLAMHGFGLVLVGGSEDEPLAERIAELSGVSPVSSAGRLRLKETMALIQRCQLFVGNDSAPLHMAAAAGTPCIALFGPTAPAQFGPLGNGHTVLYKALDCSPCFRFRGGILQYLPHCSQPRCMEAIEVREVEDAILQRLAPRDPLSTVAGGRTD